MKTIAIAALGALALAGTAHAGALSDTYVAGQLGTQTQGLTTSNIDTNEISAAVGKKFAGPLGGKVRVEGEYVRLSQSHDVKGDVANLNLAYDLHPVLGFTPFVAGGVGYADMNGEGARHNAGTMFNYSVGVSHALTKKMDVSFQYRVFTAADIDVQKRSVQFDSLHTPTLSLGLRYNF